MTNNPSGQTLSGQSQGPAVGANVISDDAVSWHYALLSKLAALDIELAKNATAMGIAADLLFPNEAAGSVSVAPTIKRHLP